MQTFELYISEDENAFGINIEKRLGDGKFIGCFEDQKQFNEAFKEKYKWAKHFKSDIDSTLRARVNWTNRPIAVAVATKNPKQIIFIPSELWDYGFLTNYIEKEVIDSRFLGINDLEPKVKIELVKKDEKNLMSL